MQYANPILIDLRRTADSGADMKVELHDDFFAGLDQDEIEGGSLQVTFRVKARACYFFDLWLQVEGEVKVACDRCLETLSLPVTASDTVKIYAGCEEDAPQDPDVTVIEAQMGYTYDAAWVTYETVLLALPPKRVHAPGECRSDMLSYLVGEQ